MSLLYKPIAIGLLLVLILVGGYTGANWWLAARDRDAARVELVAERALSAEYQVAIREQNRAAEVLSAQKTAAEAKGLAAQQVAAANGKRLDQALAATAGARATTCTEAMQTVNTILEAIK